MPTTRWEAVLARLTRHEPLDLDDLLRPLDPRAGGERGRDHLPAGVGLTPFAPQFKEEGGVAVGVRLREPPEDPAGLAGQLAAFGLERGVEVVVLSHPDYSGLERFGFRTERVVGATEAERAACERQLAAFWNLEVII